MYTAIPLASSSYLGELSVPTLMKRASSTTGNLLTILFSRLLHLELVTFKSFSTAGDSSNK